jgi:hypothetical protein
MPIISDKHHSYCCLFPPIVRAVAALSLLLAGQSIRAQMWTRILFRWTDFTGLCLVRLPIPADLSPDPTGQITAAVAQTRSSFMLLIGEP